MLQRGPSGLDVAHTVYITYKYTRCIDTGDYLQERGKKAFLYIFALAVALVAASVSLFPGLITVLNAFTANSQISGNIVVTSACTITVSNTILGFGGSSGIGPGVLSSANAVTDTNGGNAQAWIWIFGGNWIGPQSADNGNFFVSNTLYGPTASPANALFLTTANTAIFLPAPTLGSPTSNSIFMAVNVPIGTLQGVFLQTITISNTC